jgi:hypothetical protein
MESMIHEEQVRQVFLPPRIGYLLLRILLSFLANFSDLGDEAEEQQCERLGGKDATPILKYAKDTASSWIMRRSHTVLLCHLNTETLI